MSKQKTQKRNKPFKTKYNKVSKYRKKIPLFPVFFCSYQVRGKMPFDPNIFIYLDLEIHGHLLDNICKRNLFSEKQK